VIKMFDGLLIGSLVCGCYRAIKEALVEPIPAENWANKDLYHQDLMNGVPMKQCLKNAKSGKYKLNEKYPEPHRGKDGKVVIENYKLYKEDVLKYGAVQAHKWLNQGKYNLTQEELKRQEEELKKEYGLF
jgi:hypothetical protein